MKEKLRGWSLEAHWAIGILLSMLVCGPVLVSAGTNQVQRIQVTGSSTVAPLMSDIGKKFEAKHPTVRVDVQTGGSSRGIADARTGMSHIGMVSRALKSNESKLLNFTIANDGIAVIVHASNPVRQMDHSQLVNIYSGEQITWPHDPSAEIVVVNKAAGRSTLELFLKYLRLKPNEIEAHVIIGDNQQGIKVVAANPNAIGYVSIGTALYESSHGTPIRLVSLDGVAPTLENVTAGSYPIARPLNLVTRSQPSGVVRELIDFAKSSGVHDVVKQHYFVPVSR